MHSKAKLGETRIKISKDNIIHGKQQIPPIPQLPYRSSCRVKEYAITKQDKYPLLLIKKTLCSLIEVHQFIKLNIRLAFYYIWIAKGQEHFIAFRTRFKLFKQLICLFRLVKAPVIFQYYINNILKYSFNNFIITYLNNFFIFLIKLKCDYFNKIRQIFIKL